MGLDQYAEVEDQNGVVGELAYWRKHPNLQGWMENLWREKEKPPEDLDFNCVSVELDLNDLDKLESAINNGELPATSGFFFGQNSDSEYRENDLKFIQKAKKAIIEEGLIVKYRSWW